MPPPIVEARSLDIEKLAAHTQPIETLLREIHPGVRPLESRVRLLAIPDQYDQKFLRDMYMVVDALDGVLERSASGGLRWPPWGSPRFMSEKYSESTVVGQQRRYICTISDALSYHPAREKIAVACPMYGSLAIMDQLWKGFFDRQVAYGAFVSGTVGTTTGGAEIQKPLPSELLDPENIVLFADDVSDSCISVATLAMERYINMNPDFYRQDPQFRTLIPEMQRLKDERVPFSDPRQIDLYKILARLLHETKVVLAPFYNKNEYAISQILYESTAQKDNWSSLQKNLNQISVVIPENDWIMGGMGYWRYPLLDAGVNGQALTRDAKGRETKGMLSYINQKHHEKLISLGFENLYFRMGAGIKKLVVFNPDHMNSGQAYDELVEWVARFVEAYMERYGRED